MRKIIILIITIALPVLITAAGTALVDKPEQPKRTEQKQVSEVQICLEQAQNLMDKNQLKKAEKLYLQILIEQPETDFAFRALEKLTCLFIKQDLQTDAQICFEQMTNAYPKDAKMAESVYKIAEAARGFGKHEGAIRYYQYVLDNFPDSEQQIWSIRGKAISNIARGNLEEAQVSVDTLLTGFPGYPADTMAQAVFEVADAYYWFEYYPPADQLYLYVLDNYPQEDYAMWAQMGLAISNVASGNNDIVDKAVKSLLNNFSANPDMPEALGYIAGRYDWDQRYDEAMALYKQILKLNPGDISAMAGMARSHIGLGDDSAAGEIFDNLIADFSDHPALPDALFGLGKEYFYDDNRQTAIEIWELVLSNYPESGKTRSILYLLATCHKRLKNYSTAIGYYMQVLDRYPDSQYAYYAAYQIGLNYRSAGQFDKAIEWFDQQRKIYPDNQLQSQRALMHKAAVYSFDLKDYEKAAQIYQQYIGEFPYEKRLSAAYWGLAECHHKLGNKEQAVAILEEALEKFTDSQFEVDVLGKLERWRKGETQ